jgi:hypothetical protein
MKTGSDELTVHASIINTNTLLATQLHFLATHKNQSARASQATGRCSPVATPGVRLSTGAVVSYFLPRQTGPRPQPTGISSSYGAKYEDRRLLGGRAVYTDTS